MSDRSFSFASRSEGGVGGFAVIYEECEYNKSQTMTLLKKIFFHVSIIERAVD